MANNQYNFLDYAGLSLFWNNVKNIIEENELATASALTNLDTRVDNLEASKADKEHAHTFASLTSKPTTISGYGITDALTTSNYTSYTVKKDGTGASGTWGINISGNAATATNADKLDGYHASSFSLTNHTHSYIVTQGDNRSTATKPSDYSNRITFTGLKTNDTVGNPSSTIYNYVVGLRGWSDTSGGKAHELAFNDTGVFHRIGATDTWEDWAMMLTTSNYNSYAPSLTGSGASGTWGISITGNANYAKASDVKAWAKADTKPSYTGTEVTLSGYSKNNSYTPIASGDTVQAAIAKLEGAINGLEDLLASI